MKSKLAGSFLIVFLSLIFISCEEDFNPKTELKNEYIFNCNVLMYHYITSSETAPKPTIKAVISRTYDVDGFIPQKPDSSLFVPKADITFFSYGKEYHLIDSAINHLKAGDSITRYNYYFWPADQLPKLLGNDQCSISAVMPDGKVLTASTVTPRPVFFDMSRSFNHGITTDVNRFFAGNELSIFWGDPVPGSLLYFPRFVIYARVISQQKSLQIEIPCKCIMKNDRLTPVYPQASNNPFVSFEFDAIDFAMKSIAEGKYDPGDIRVDNCSFTLTEYDPNLSAYYSSTHGYMDSYSVRLDETIYSNISGGLGIFSSAMVNIEYFPIDKNYILSFGYKTSND